MNMNNLQNITFSLRQIVNEIKDGHYVIPKFQRDFVWKPKDIEELGDSMLRQYPISSILLMPTNGSLKVSNDPLFEVSQAPLKTFHVLDGQQRLTSIRKLFVKYEEFEFYFDMLSILCAYHPDKISHDKSVETLCKGFKKSRAESDTREDGRYIRCDLVINGQYASKINSYLNFLESSHAISSERKDEFINHLNSLFGYLSNFPLPVTKIDENAELKVVIRVFEKVNTTGKKLTLFDLINAKSFEYQNHKHGLTDFLEGEVLRLGEDVSMFFNEDFSKFVRAYFIYDKLSKSISPDLSSQEMLDKTPDFWFKGWGDNKEIIKNFVKVLDQNEILKNHHSGFVEYMLGIVMAEPRLINETKWWDEVKRFSLYLTLTSGTFNKSNLDLVKDFKIFGDNIVKAKGMGRECLTLPDKISNNYNLKIVEDAMGQKMNKGQKMESAWMILRLNGLFSVDLSGCKTVLSAFDKHHIVPKALKQGDCFDTIGNFTLLNPNTNRKSVKDLHPSYYLNTLKRSKGVQEYQMISKQNLVFGLEEIGERDDVKLVSFIEKRGVQMTKIIIDYFSKR